MDRRARKLFENSSGTMPRKPEAAGAAVVADTFSRLFPDADQHERTEDTMLAHTQEDTY